MKRLRLLWFWYLLRCVTSFVATDADRISSSAYKLNDRVRVRVHTDFLDHEKLNVTFLPDGFVAVARSTISSEGVAACLMVKNDRNSLEEWVAHHRALGIERIYVMDDGSSPPLLTCLLEGVASGLIHYRFLINLNTTGRNRQLFMYDQCLALHGSQHAWMTFFDVDEFLFIRDHQKGLPALLEGYKEYAALVVNWRVFGSGGRLQPPRRRERIVRSFTNCTARTHPVNSQVKSIVQPKYTLGTGEDPHHFRFQEGKYAVATDLSRVAGAFHEVPKTEVAVLHHYFTKSLTEFLQKIERGSATGNRGKSWTDFITHDEVMTALPNEKRHSITPEPIGRTAEGVLPDTFELAKPLAHSAKLILRAVLDSLGQVASPGIKNIQNLL